MRSYLALIGLAILAVLLAGGWLARDEIAGFVTRMTRSDEAAAEAASSPETAASELVGGVEAKIIALGQGETDEIALDAEQVGAWIGSMAGFLPDYVSDLSAGIEEERLKLSGRVAVGDVPGADRLGPLAELLGDTADVAVRGRLDGLQPGWGVLYVDELRIGVVPLPEAMRDDLLSRLKGGRANGLPVNAVPFQLPRFVSDVGVRGDSVFLRSPVRRR